MTTEATPQGHSDGNHTFSDQPGPNQTDPMLQHFRWKHLPSHLQEVSKPFGQQAARLVRTTPRNPERTAALRHLLEAKDCAVRSVLPSAVVTVDELE